MAYLRDRPNSPFWYLKFRDLDTGEWKSKCLKLRKDDPKDTLRAQKDAAKASAAEAKVSPTVGENFAEWVPEYIQSHYKNPRSVLRYGYVWGTISAWLASKKIRHPREIKYEHAGEYMAWRKGAGASHNTARMEVKWMSFLISEAIRREYADRNVLALARLELAPAKIKKDLTDEDIQAARQAFEDRPKWMGVAFEIMIHLGCRFAESRILKERIDFKNGTVVIIDSKRQPTDPRKFFTAPLPEQLATYLSGIEWHDGATLPAMNPPLDRTMNRDFNYVLFKATGATSHSCRVSFVSRCHRSGLTEMEAMRLVNHSTRMVHRIYSRLNVEDARKAMLRVSVPPPPLQETT